MLIIIKKMRNQRANFLDNSKPGQKEPDLTHMPEYIKNVPFYLASGSSQPVLEH
jgi:pre-mRNA-processing factor SLU7